MKNIIFAGIITSLLLLLVLPAAASDYTLGVYGNANEDDTINMQDVTYTELIILEYKEATELADARYDGEIDILDVTQIELIILGQESELTIIDCFDRIVAIDKPIESIVLTYHGTAEVIKAIGAADKVIGVGDSVLEHGGEIFFPELSKLPLVGTDSKPDIEKILELEPDLVIFMESVDLETIELLESSGITAVVMISHGDLFTYTDVTKKIGYALGVVDKATKYIDWYQGYLDMIAERVEEISEEDKPLVYYCWGRTADDHLGTVAEDCPGSMLLEFAGGINIAGELPGSYISVDSEWVIVQNPSIIIRDSWGEVAGYTVDNPSAADAAILSIKNQPGWEAIDAVEEGDVNIIAVDITCGSSFISAVYLAKLFHPELFEDLDPQAFHQEHLTRFQQLDFNIYEQGVLFYPIPKEW